jgi:hypothetical protein
MVIGPLPLHWKEAVTLSLETHDEEDLDPSRVR